jgi:hypothetical protein
MVGTRSTHPMQDPPLGAASGAPGASNNQEQVEFMRRMTESIEALKKQNEDLNTRPTVAEGRSSRRDSEQEERRERERHRTDS